MILILEQTTGHVRYFRTAAPERSGAPDGMARLLSIGGRIVEQLDSRESKTGTQEIIWLIWCAMLQCFGLVVGVVFICLSLKSPKHPADGIIFLIGCFSIFLVLLYLQP